MPLDDKTILIAGPTASGKSALALRLAEALGGAVINADSMQVYAELRLLSARPSPDDEARVPHHLYGHVPAREAYSAGRFVADAAAAIAEVRAEGMRPILVGGTGLYFKALLEGLSPIPAVDEATRAHWRAESDRVGARSLHSVLAERDAAMAAQLNPSDTQRIVRALEVLSSTGRSLRDWQQERGVPLLAAEQTVRLVVSGERSWLAERADARVERMVADGALAEAEALDRLGLDSGLPAMRAIGVAPMIAAARRDIALQDAIARAKGETRQYIKRQQTWLSRHMIAWIYIETQQKESKMADIIAFIQS